MIRYLVIAAATLAVAIGIYVSMPADACAYGGCVPVFCGRSLPCTFQGCGCQYGPDGITGFCG